MGQYYTLTCHDTGSLVHAPDIGSGLKAMEQICSTTPGAAFAVLTAGPRGDHPRDLPWLPRSPWAGRMVLMVGDYAQPGDLVGREDLTGPDEQVLLNTGHRRDAPLDARPRRRKHPINFSAALRPVLERALGVRFPGLRADGREIHRAARFIIPVSPDPESPGDWRLDIESDDPADIAKDTAFYRRICGGVDSWRRPPLDLHPKAHFTPHGMSAETLPDTVPPATDGTGTPLIWVNLDRGEILDPAQLDPAPDLSGIMAGESPGIVLAMITHAESRGGGDLPEMGPLDIAARWRGDRIVLLGDQPFQPPRGRRITAELARAEFVDITDAALAWTRSRVLERDAVIDWNHHERLVSARAPAESMPGDTVKQAIAVAMQDPTVWKMLHDEGPGSLEFTCLPPLRVDSGRTTHVGIPGSLHLPARFDVWTRTGGKVWLRPETQSRIRTALADLPERPLPMRCDRTNGIYRQERIQIDDSGKITFIISSMHEMMSALDPAPDPTR